MAAPTFVQEAETAWNTAANKTTASYAVLLNDILVALGVGEGWSSASDNIAIANGPTWTVEESHRVGSNCSVTVSVGTAGSNTSYTTDFTDTSATQFMGGNVLTFRASDGIGASEKAQGSGAPTLNITTLQANSALVVVVADFNAADGASRTWRTVNGITPTAGNSMELTYFRDGSRYTVYIAYYSDAGATGSKTVGLSAPSGQSYSIIAVEIKGTAGGAVIDPGVILNSATVIATPFYGLN
jgi:hypothetical protein